MKSDARNERSRRASALFLALSIVLGVLACAVGGSGSVPPQRWRKDRGPVEVFAARGCAGCHEDVHRGKLGRGCTDCHDEARIDWDPRAEIALHQRTRFPLVGAHATTACFACHPGAQVGNFERADTACVTCHRDDLASATSPDHAMQGWIDDCEDCHAPTTWGGAGFNHAQFPLSGAHSAIACESCHAGGVFGGTPSACVACHQDDYDATRAPDHAQAGFPTTCQECHDTSTWENAHFDHASFPLTGAHVALACAACHAGGVFDGTPSACVACHQDDYRATTDPNHALAGLPTTCQQCHGTNSWRDADFSHAGVVAGCVQCHLKDYNGASDPNHVAAGLPTTCQNCHGTNDWNDADFSHRGISAGCVVCHLADYNGANDPNHAAAGFPTTCQSCHGTNDWEDASFVHDFPITSGEHGGFSCQQCHLAPGSFRSFSCTHCHAHDQREMADEHRRVGGYAYQSSACLACHPDGKER